MNKPFRVCLLPVLLLPKSGKPKKRSVAKLGLNPAAMRDVPNHPAGHKPIKNERNYWKKNRDDQHFRSQR